MNQGINPFDDASGEQFLGWLGGKGGFPTRINNGVTAAGTTITDSTDISSGTSVVETATANQGVKLPNVGIGEVVGVINSTAATIKVYPNTAAQKISYGGSAGAAASILTHVGAFFLRVTDEQWVKIAIS